MIRFSAALVAVAIGVLIGGIATSKLLLVYIAIVVSAVALLVLAIGVVLKRKVLFGEGQGLVPAGAGAAPVRPARAGESQDQLRPAVSVSPPAPFQGPAAGHGTDLGGTDLDGTDLGGTALRGTAQVAPPVTAPPPSAANQPAPHQAAGGRDRVADPAPAWEALSARDQWSPSPWQASTAAGPAPDWMPSGRGASDRTGQAGATADPGRQAGATASPLSSAVSATPPAPSGPSSAGSGFAQQNWFAPQTRPADAVPPATQAAADAATADEDDWPARYPWLDDEADESPGGADPAVAPAGQDPAPGAAAVDAPAGDDRASDAPADDDPASDAPADDTPADDASAGDAAAGETAPDETAAATATDAGQEPGAAEPETRDADGEPPSDGHAGPAPSGEMVTVLPGVPRYHQPDCVLIRFMPEDDIQRLPAAQAKADGCTPCAACQPVG